MKIWKRSSTNPSKLALVKKEEINFSDPVLFYFGGAFATEEEKIDVKHYPEHVRRFFDHLVQYVQEVDTLFGDFDKKIKGYINVAYKILGKYKESDTPPHIFCASYKNAEQCLIDLEHFNRRSDDFFSTEAAQFVAENLLPRICKNPRLHDKGQGITCDELYPVGTATSNLQNVTLMGHSYGTSFGIQIQNALKHYLKELSIDELQIEKLMQSVCFMGVSSVLNIYEMKQPSFQSVIIEGDQDRVAEHFNPQQYVPGKLKASEDVKIYRTPSNNLIFRVKVPETHTSWKETVDGIDLQFVNGDKAGHNVAFYFLRGTPPSIVPELVERVIRNMVMRSMHDRPMVYPDDLLEPAPPVQKTTYYSPANSWGPDARRLNVALTKEMPPFSQAKKPMEK